MRTGGLGKLESGYKYPIGYYGPLATLSIPVDCKAFADASLIILVKG